MSIPANGKTSDPRTVAQGRTGKPRASRVDGHLSDRNLHSYATAWLRYIKRHRLNKRQMREALQKVEEIRLELIQIRRLKQARAAGTMQRTVEDERASLEEKVSPTS